MATSQVAASFARETRRRWPSTRATRAPSAETPSPRGDHAGLVPRPLDGRVADRALVVGVFLGLARLLARPPALEVIDGLAVLPVLVEDAERGEHRHSESRGSLAFHGTPPEIVAAAPH